MRFPPPPPPPSFQNSIIPSFFLPLGGALNTAVKLNTQGQSVGPCLGNCLDSPVNLLTPSAFPVR